MQDESVMTVIILTNKFGSKLIKCLQSIPKKWSVLICSPDKKLPKSIDKLHPLIDHWPMPDHNIQDFAKVRNLALQQVKTNWAFFLDSDEVLDNFDQLQLNKLLWDQNIDGLTVTRSDVFHDQKLRFGEAGNQTLTRLIRVNRGHFVGNVHEQAVVYGQVVSSGISLTHFSHNSISQFITQVSKYANLSIKLHQSKSGLRLLTELLFYPPLKFLLNYFFKLGFLDGWQGLVYTLIMSLHSTLVRLMTLQHRIIHTRKSDKDAIIPNHRRHLKLVSGSSNPRIDHRFRMLSLGLSLGLLVLLPFGQLLRWSIADNIAVYPHDIILSLLVLTLTIDLFRSKSKTLWQQILPWRLEIAVWCYFWLPGVIKLFGLDDSTQFLIISRLGVYVLGLLVAINSLSHCRFKLNTQYLHARHFWLASLGLFAWLSFTLYLVFPDMRGLSFFGWDDHYFRLVGTLFDPNYTGLVLSTGVLINLGGLGLKNPYSSAIHRWLTPILILFFAVCLALTFSRGSWLSFGFATTALIAMKLIKKQLSWQQLSLIFVTILLFLSTVVLAPKPGGEGVDLSRSASVNARLAFDQYILQSLSTSDWIFGKIVDQPVDELNHLAKNNQPAINSDRSTNPPVAFHPKTANNLFVTSLLWGGIIGLSLVIILLGKWSWQLYRSSPVSLSILIAWFIHAQFNNSFLEPFVFLFVGGSILSLMFKVGR